MEDYKILLKVNLVHPACFATLHFTSSPIKFPSAVISVLFTPPTNMGQQNHPDFPQAVADHFKA